MIDMKCLTVLQPVTRWCQLHPITIVMMYVFRSAASQKTFFGGRPQSSKALQILQRQLQPNHVPTAIYHVVSTCFHFVTTSECPKNLTNPLATACDSHQGNTPSTLIALEENFDQQESRPIVCWAMGISTGDLHPHQICGELWLQHTSTVLQCTSHPRGPLPSSCWSRPRLRKNPKKKLRETLRKIWFMLLTIARRVTEVVLLGGWTSRHDIHTIDSPHLLDVNEVARFLMAFGWSFFEPVLWFVSWWLWCGENSLQRFAVGNLAQLRLLLPPG